ncbi:MAG: translation elongation factor Ts [Patescibacteria group bacterium]|nr:translation elongation factor Ts [Patescibacteria group bacterium]
MTSKINVKDIQKLRDLTGAGVMDAKQALSETKGDLEEAVEWIKQKGLVKIAKREGRETGAGLIESYTHNERIGVILDVRAETDFVVRSQPFRDMAHEVAMQIAAMNPENAEELLKQPYIKDESKTINDLLNDVRNRVGENIKINKFYRLEI